MRPATATTLSTTPAPGRRVARKPASRAVLKAATAQLCSLGTWQVLAVKLSDDARQTVWERCLTPASVSSTTALQRPRMGAILAHPKTRAFQRQLIDETLAVAQAVGAVLRPGLADEMHEHDHAV